jgi:hypothetical protein
MTPNPCCLGSARSADEWNTAIRELWTDPRVQLTREGRAEYERLLAGWAAALKAELIEAA